eukprot:SAG31_NODE_2561_length_5481_cov_2.689335_8_plen_226_part_01
MVMAQAWPCEPARCTVVCPASATTEVTEETEQNILQNEIDTYHAKGWKSIAQLYGVKGDQPDTCSLPLTYALIKLKAIEAAQPGRRVDNIVKSRPIAPHTKHPNKHVYNRTATAHHFMLTAIRTTGQRVTRLWSTADYPRRLRNESAQLQRQLTAMGGGRLRSVIAVGDLDGMYTNITHARMDAALDSNIERLRASVSDNRRYTLRCLDRISVGRNKTKTKQDWRT